MSEPRGNADQPIINCSRFDRVPEFFYRPSFGTTLR